MPDPIYDRYLRNQRRKDRAFKVLLFVLLLAACAPHLLRIAQLLGAR